MFPCKRNGITEHPLGGGAGGTFSVVFFVIQSRDLEKVGSFFAYFDFAGDPIGVANSVAQGALMGRYDEGGLMGGVVSVCVCVLMG